ncbi:uncharacterized protein TNCT_562361 [Trichonephila clavata]|uniref:Uncharacterized protein n=1 Tax=Trichonephila clavata TaxID=2740835 RepID=A0A8X6LTH2_TRICU|nr:uncharacterized protein TNCT_53541 [Trichonephila clavata]GFR22376.1 uncharacterized protein TNCT_562361 [Trichonephila clavata]
MLDVLIVTCVPSPSLHGVLPASFEQSSSTILNPSNDLTRLNVTYACLLANSAGLRYTTACSTVHPCILWTVQAQHSISGSCVRSIVP